MICRWLETAGEAAWCGRSVLFEVRLVDGSVALGVSVSLMDSSVVYGAMTIGVELAGRISLDSSAGTIRIVPIVTGI